jgi:chromosomal replication initiation ATPase DnaA
MTDATSIINDVAECYGVTAEALLSTKRARPLPDARSIVSWLLCYTLHMSTTEVGEALHRDHSTVLFAIKKVDDWTSMPKMYARELGLISKLHKKYGTVDETGD